MYMKVHEWSCGYDATVADDEIAVSDLRAKLADVLNDSAVRGRITYVTSRGRRIAAVVPVQLAEAAEAEQPPDRLS
jgi:prevent-host-death family protein